MKNQITRLLEVTGKGFLRPKNKINKLQFKSLFTMVIGIFLLPQLCFALTTDITSSKLINLTNETRESNNLKALSESNVLNRAAYQKALDILENQIFSHQIKDKKFSEWIEEVDYEYYYAGENLAIDFISSQNIMDAWLDSKSHKENLLNSSYEEIGVATVEGTFNDQETVVVVQIFGTPYANSIYSQKEDEEIIKNSPSALSPTIKNAHVLNIEKMGKEFYIQNASTENKFIINKSVIQSKIQKIIEKNYFTDVVNFTNKTFYTLFFLLFTFGYFNLLKRFV